MMCISGAYLPIAYYKEMIHRMFFQQQLTVLNWSDVCYTFQKANLHPTAKAHILYWSFIVDEFTNCSMCKWDFVNTVPALKLISFTFACLIPQI